MILLWIWGIVTAVALVAEFFTAKLIAVWFVAGGLIDLLVVALVPNLHFTWQILIFAGVSLLLLLSTRKLCLKLLTDDKSKKYINLIGKRFIIDNITNNYSYHTLDGMCWRVYTIDKSDLKIDDICEICSIGTNKLIVKIVGSKTSSAKNDIDG